VIQAKTQEHLDHDGMGAFSGRMTESNVNLKYLKKEILQISCTLQVWHIDLDLLIHSKNKII
jgi:hypothetical protein